MLLKVFRQKEIVLVRILQQKLRLKLSMKIITILIMARLLGLNYKKPSILKFQKYL